HLADNYLGTTKLDLVDRYQGAVRALDLNFDRVFVNLSTVSSLFNSSEDGVRLVDTDDIQYQLVHTLNSLSAQAKTGKVTTKYVNVHQCVFASTLCSQESCHYQYLPSRLTPFVLT